MNTLLIRRLEVLLRAGIAFCFIGHGAFGLLRKEAWLSYFTLFGIEPAAASVLMPLVGSVDILIGLLVLAWPTRALLAYAIGWCVFTAALRPLAGEGVWELLERAGNYGVPLALLIWLGARPGLTSWFARMRTTELEPQRVSVMLQAIRWTTAALLVGHGMLAIGRKPLLVDHLAAVGLIGDAIIALGVIELGLAALCIIRPSVTLFGGIALWKICTESLFLVTGAPVWEFIERGGSYAAPLAGALVLAAMRAPAVASTVPGRPRAAQAALRTGAVLFVCMLAPLTTPVRAQTAEKPAAFDEAAAAELRRGGYVLACRHGITDNDASDRQPVSFDDPTTQRILNAAGERQMRAAGELVARSGVVFTEIRTSPYQRTRRSAELMFGNATVDDALYSGGSRRRRTALFREPVAPGGNRVLMTHQGILYPALSLPRGTISEGDCIMVRPTGSGVEVVARIRPDDWTIYRVSR